MNLYYITVCIGVNNKLLVLVLVLVYAGVVPQMSPPPHDLERLRTTMVDFIVVFNRGRSVVSWTVYG